MFRIYQIPVEKTLEILIRRFKNIGVQSVCQMKNLKRGNIVKIFLNRKSYLSIYHMKTLFMYFVF